MESTSIGLDIGASAIRAAEISIGRDGRALRHYAQVGLPPGAVVDGEVINPTVVAESLRRLWSIGGFTGAKVVLGVSGHRVIVRQADVPALDEEDLRSALRFDAQELIPIPMDEASFDFRILDRGSGPGDDGKSSMRILLVAAHRDLLRSHLAALKVAGLEAVAVDASPLALMRVVPPSGPRPDGGNRVEALVAIGAEITTVAVRQGAQPRFIRSLAVGGAKLTAGLANAMHVDAAVAERLKRGAIPAGSPHLIQARRVVSGELQDLAEEVRATIEFFVAQSDEPLVQALLVTGGASQTDGLVEALAGTSAAVVQRIDPFSTLDISGCGLSEVDLGRARATAATAVGLALWPTEPPGTRLSVLPDEVRAARRARRIVTLAGAGVAGVAGLLAAAGVTQVLAVHDAKQQVHVAEAQVSTLQGQVNSLQAATVVHGKVAARRGLEVTALTGDIDWVGMLAQINAGMPKSLQITSFSASRAAPSGAGSAARSSTASTGVGTVNFTLTGSGGLPVVSAWLDAMQHIRAFQGTWVSGITVAGNTVNFGSTANITSSATSTRAQQVKK